MQRRDFLGLGLTLTATGILAKTLMTPETSAAKAVAKGGAPAAGGITDDKILWEGMPSQLANYCDADKQPNKACPDWKAKPGKCAECSFFNTDNSEAPYGGKKAEAKGKKVAHCQLLAQAPRNYVPENFYCATFNKKA